MAASQQDGNFDAESLATARAGNDIVVCVGVARKLLHLAVLTVFIAER